MSDLAKAKGAGMKARRRGASLFDNPFEADAEMPPRTGEATEHWFAKFNAWRTGWAQGAGTGDAKEKTSP